MPKIETTSKLSLKLPSRINLGRWGGHTRRALDLRQPMSRTPKPAKDQKIPEPGSNRRSRTTPTHRAQNKHHASRTARPPPAKNKQNNIQSNVYSRPPIAPDPTCPALVSHGETNLSPPLYQYPLYPASNALNTSLRYLCRLGEAPITNTITWITWPGDASRVPF